MRVMGVPNTLLLRKEKAGALHLWRLSEHADYVSLQLLSVGGAHHEPFGRAP